MALKKGVMEASPILLEPIMNVEVTVPEYQMGDVMGDLNKRRGRIMEWNPMTATRLLRPSAYGRNV